MTDEPTRTGALPTGDNPAADASSPPIAAFARDRDEARRFGVPVAAIRPLVLCLETSVLGGLAIAASDHAAGADRLLLWVGWGLMGLASAFALLFAARTERRDARSSSAGE